MWNYVFRHYFVSYFVSLLVAGCSLFVRADLGHCDSGYLASYCHLSFIVYCYCYCCVCTFIIIMFHHRVSNFCFVVVVFFHKARVAFFSDFPIWILNIENGNTDLCNSIHYDNLLFVVVIYCSPITSSSFPISSIHFYCIHTLLSLHYTQLHLISLH